jgi:DNA transformation protein
MIVEKPMAIQNRFVASVLAQMRDVIGPVRARAMFGGYGVYQDDTMFAIVGDDTLYFKADGTTSGAFTARSLNPFTYVSRGRTVALQYYEAPPEVFEEVEAMRLWSQQAIEVALRARKIHGQ